MTPDRFRCYLATKDEAGKVHGTVTHKAIDELPSGDVLIRDGHATVLSVAIAGSGDVTHNGAAQRLDAVVLGSGDVRVHQVNGPVSRQVFGGGDVVVGR